MQPLRFVNDVDSLLRGADHLVVVAPGARLARDAFPPVLPDAVAEWVKLLAKDLTAGESGALASTLTRTTPRKVTVAALPDKFSRHNSPSRAEAIRRAVAAASLAGKGRGAILIVVDEKDHLLAAANAVFRALPTFSRRSGKRGDASGASGKADVRLLVVDRYGKPLRPDPGQRAVCEGTREMAALVDTPPTELDPKAFASRARKYLAGLRGIRVREIAGDALRKSKLLGIHAVGRAATTAPRLLIASYSPRRGGGVHVALVGKGITYDTGGLSIKSTANMIGMKADMAGAAATLGAFRALVVAGCRHRVTLLLCLAENAIGPSAYKVDDILTLHSGKTVEINNTDAEGRLLLADAVSYAARVVGARVVLDAATLTGAQLVATGLLHAGVVSNDEALEGLLIAAGRESGDLCHPLPFAPEVFRQELKSPIADMRNSVKDRNNAPSSCAAQFIWSHIEDVAGVRYGHVDLAGPAFPHDRATGFGVALLYRAVTAL